MPNPGSVTSAQCFVEDDSAVAEMYKLKLELDGHRVGIARDGETGLSMARECTPDIIFLDIALPGMNRDKGQD